MPVILGIDYGERRLGLAISDPAGIVAVPLSVVEVRSLQQACRKVAEVCREKNPQCVVVGLPVNMDGSRGEMARRVEEFAKILRTHVNVPVELWDERLSTRIVERGLQDSEVGRGTRKRVTDKLAAQVILQSYLDAKQEEACRDTV